MFAKKVLIIFFLLEWVCLKCLKKIVFRKIAFNGNNELWKWSFLNNFPVITNWISITISLHLQTISTRLLWIRTAGNFVGSRYYGFCFHVSSQYIFNLSINERLIIRKMGKSYTRFSGICMDHQHAVWHYRLCNISNSFARWF